MSANEKANLLDTIRHMVAVSNQSYSDVSRKLGRARNFVSVMFRDGTTPRTDLLARLADACGYELYLVGHGEALQVTGERSDDSPVTVRHKYRVEKTASGGMTFTPETVDRGWALGWDDEATVTDAPPDDWS